MCMMAHYNVEGCKKTALHNGADIKKGHITILSWGLLSRNSKGKEKYFYEFWIIDLVCFILNSLSPSRKVCKIISMPTWGLST